jgi:hypothetical protein
MSQRRNPGVYLNDEGISESKREDVMFAVARLYETEGQARAASDALIERGFARKSVVVLSKGVDQFGGGTTTADAVRAGGFLGENAAFYAEQMSQGYTLVVVGAEFGASGTARAVLNEYNPLPITHEPTPEPYVPWTERPYAFSSLLGLPMLTKSETPFSDFWGFKTSQTGFSHLSRWLSPLSTFSFSSMIGMRPLTANGTALSSMVGMSTKSTRNEGKSGSMGMSFKTKSATPFSSLFGLPLLTRRKHFLS